MRKNNIKILMIEDNSGDVDYIEDILSEDKHSSFDIKWTDTLSKGLEIIAKKDFDVILLDLGLPDSQGIETLQTVLSKFPDMAIIVLTGLDDEIMGIKTVQRGAQDYLVKGKVDTNILVRTVRFAMERKQIQEALKRSEEQYRNIIELAPDGIITIDLKGNVTSCNTSFLHISGYSHDEIVGRHFTKIPTLRMRDMPSYIKLFTSMVMGKMPGPMEIVWLKKDLTERIGEIRLSKMKKGSKITGFQAILRDVTERKRTEEALKEKTKKLERFSKLAVGREKKMIEMKKRIQELEDTLGGYKKGRVK